MMRVIDRWRYQDQAILRRTAAGELPADLAIVNCSVADVNTLSCYPGEVFVANGVIVHVESDPANFRGAEADAKVVYDAGGGFLAPGLMDSHVHVESSMLTPKHFGEAVAVYGTTSIFTDCHELVNVAGQTAFRFMLEDGKRSPIRQFMLIPSCVPSVPGLEEAGARIVGRDVEDLAGLDRELALGLGEVMNYPGVIQGDPLMTEILRTAKDCGLYLQSHYYKLFGRELSAYLVQGLGGNHELRTEEEVVETLRKGGWVDLKGGSSMPVWAHDFFPDLLDAVRRFPNPDVLKVTLCTDDRHAADIENKGHMNVAVQRVIDAGFVPIGALSWGTRKVAEEYGIANLGSVAVGNLADVMVLETLDRVVPTAVFVSGKLVAEKGELAEGAKQKRIPAPEALLKSVKLTAVKTGDLEIRAPLAEPVNVKANANVKVNAIDFTRKITELVAEEIPVSREGTLRLPQEGDFACLAVLNRYGTGGRGIGVIKNFGLQGGAVASTVSHDSHNLTVVYRDVEDAVKAVNALIERQGGLAVSFGGRLATVELPIGGLISELPAAELSEALSRFEALYYQAFGGKEVSLLKVATTSLIVSPKFKLSDKGIVDVLEQKLVPLFPDFSDYRP
ncbi:MAG: amidohydrolase family protein [Synergistaceae bacterium]|jgi:adenine deaminase|nr:amidohydrolase family protein [Synergistaceae bacterium]